MLRLQLIFLKEIDFLADGKILALLIDVQSSVTQVQLSARQGQLLREGLQVSDYLQANPMQASRVYLMP